MELTVPQLQILKGDINTNPDPEFAAYRDTGSTGGMAEWYNVNSTFIVYKPTELTTAIGDVVSYVAVAALVDSNVNQLNLFYTMQPQNFEPNHADQRDYLADIFSGALGGAGQATRDALEILYRRPALKGEKLYCTGTGTTVAPGALNSTAQGQMTNQNIIDALAS
jgi:hypothetical protein